MRTKIIDGVEWELHGPFCELCGNHMGLMYNNKKDSYTLPRWKNPNDYNAYGDNTCSKCGQKYIYNEGPMMDLSEKQLDLLRGA